MNTFLSPVLITTRLLWHAQSRGVNLRNILITAATFYESSDSLNGLMKFTKFFNVFSSNLSRIRDYLLLEEWAGQPEINENSHKTLAQRLDKLPNSRVVEFSNVVLAPQGLSDAVLVRLSITLDRGEIMMVAGPAKCGKTTFLLSLLHESSVLGGSAFINTGRVAFCGQNAWICNSSVRHNIVGGLEFDITWYNRVLEACCLKDDFQSLPQFDKTFVQIDSVDLTEEQKHKIVSRTR